MDVMQMELKKLIKSFRQNSSSNFNITETDPSPHQAGRNSIQLSHPSEKNINYSQTPQNQQFTQTQFQGQINAPTQVGNTGNINVQQFKQEQKSILTLKNAFIQQRDDSRIENSQPQQGGYFPITQVINLQASPNREQQQKAIYPAKQQMNEQTSLRPQVQQQQLTSPGRIAQTQNYQLQQQQQQQELLQQQQQIKQQLLFQQQQQQLKQQYLQQQAAQIQLTQSQQPTVSYSNLPTQQTQQPFNLARSFQSVSPGKIVFNNDGIGFAKRDAFQSESKATVMQSKPSTRAEQLLKDQPVQLITKSNLDSFQQSEPQSYVQKPPFQGEFIEATFNPNKNKQFYSFNETTLPSFPQPPTNQNYVQPQQGSANMREPERHPYSPRMFQERKMVSQPQQSFDSYQLQAASNHIQPQTNSIQHPNHLAQNYPNSQYPQQQVSSGLQADQYTTQNAQTLGQSRDYGAQQYQASSNLNNQTYQHQQASYSLQNNASYDAAGQKVYTFESSQETNPRPLHYSNQTAAQTDISHGYLSHTPYSNETLPASKVSKTEAFLSERKHFSSPYESLPQTDKTYQSYFPIADNQTQNIPLRHQPEALPVGKLFSPKSNRSQAILNQQSFSTEQPYGYLNNLKSEFEKDQEIKDNQLRSQQQRVLTDQHSQFQQHIAAKQQLNQPGNQDYFAQLSEENKYSTESPPNQVFQQENVQDNKFNQQQQQFLRPSEQLQQGKQPSEAIDAAPQQEPDTVSLIKGKLSSLFKLMIQQQSQPNQTESKTINANQHEIQKDNQNKIPIDNKDNVPQENVSQKGSSGNTQDNIKQNNIQLPIYPIDSLKPSLLPYSKTLEPIKGEPEILTLIKEKLRTLHHTKANSNEEEQEEQWLRQSKYEKENQFQQPLKPQETNQADERKGIPQIPIQSIEQNNQQSSNLNQNSSKEQQLDQQNSTKQTNMDILQQIKKQLSSLHTTRNLNQNVQEINPNSPHRVSQEQNNMSSNGETISRTNYYPFPEAPAQNSDKHIKNSPTNKGQLHSPTNRTFKNSPKNKNEGYLPTHHKGLLTDWDELNEKLEKNSKQFQEDLKISQSQQANLPFVHSPTNAQQSQQNILSQKPNPPHFYLSEEPTKAQTAQQDFSQKGEVTPVKSMPFIESEPDQKYPSYLNYQPAFTERKATGKETAQDSFSYPQSNIKDKATGYYFQTNTKSELSNNLPQLTSKSYSAQKPSFNYNSHQIQMSPDIQSILDRYIKPPQTTQLPQSTSSNQLPTNSDLTSRNTEAESNMVASLQLSQQTESSSSPIPLTADQADLLNHQEIIQQQEIQISQQKEILIPPNISSLKQIVSVENEKAIVQTESASQVELVRQTDCQSEHIQSQKEIISIISDNQAQVQENQNEKERERVESNEVKVNTQESLSQEVVAAEIIPSNKEKTEQSLNSAQVDHVSHQEIEKFSQQAQEKVQISSTQNQRVDQSQPQIIEQSVGQAEEQTKVQPDQLEELDNQEIKNETIANVITQQSQNETFQMKEQEITGQLSNHSEQQESKEQYIVANNPDSTAENISETIKDNYQPINEQVQSDAQENQEQSQEQLQIQSQLVVSQEAPNEQEEVEIQDQTAVQSDQPLAPSDKSFIPLVHEETQEKQESVEQINLEISLPLNSIDLSPNEQSGLVISKDISVSVNDSSSNLPQTQQEIQQQSEQHQNQSSESESRQKINPPLQQQPNQPDNLHPYEPNTLLESYAEFASPSPPANTAQREDLSALYPNIDSLVLLHKMLNCFSCEQVLAQLFDGFSSSIYRITKSYFTYRFMSLALAYYPKAKQENLIKEVQALFDLSDKRKDWHLDINDLGQTLKQLCKPNLYPSDMERLFTKMDINKEGSIKLDQFIEYAKQKEIDSVSAKKIFDNNSKGFLTFYDILFQKKNPYVSKWCSQKY